MYCYFSNGQLLDGPKALPVTFGLVSNFNLLTDSQLADYNWFPFTSEPFPEFDCIYYDVTPSYQKIGTTVHRSYTLVEKSPEAVDVALATERAVAKNEVNTLAGASRARHITNIPGQESTYLLKESEALAWLNNPEGTYQILQAEAAACGMTMQQTVDLVMTVAGQFRALAAAVEGLRRGAIVAIEQATTYAAIRNAIPTQWP